LLANANEAVIHALRSIGCFGLAIIFRHALPHHQLSIQGCQLIGKNCESL